MDFDKALAMSTPRTPSDYKAARSVYLPRKIRAVIIAESPPVSGKYFYDPSGEVSEPLFSELTKRLLGGLYPTKATGLSAFQEAGFVLVDATYTSIDDRSPVDRVKIIENGYSKLLDDLQELLVDRSVPLILVKKNVCELLEPRLTRDGYRVANRGRVVYFPSSGQQGKFREQIRPILEELGLASEH